jgi:hypothetical protein
LRTFDRDLLTPAVLEVCDEHTVRARWRMSRVLTLIGRARRCKVRLHSERVSGYHAALVSTPEGIWVVDLLSREGTCVNGQPVRLGAVRDGDRLEMGGTVIRLWYDTALSFGPRRLAAPPEPPSDTPAPPREYAGGEARDEPRGMVGSLAPVPGATMPPPARCTPAALGPVVTQGDGSLLPRMMGQFSQMLQTFDQFQESMLVMVRLFTSMHRDQMQLAREQLDRLEELTRELKGLRADAARSQPAPVVQAEPLVRVCEVNPVSRPPNEPLPTQAEWAAPEPPLAHPAEQPIAGAPGGAEGQRADERHTAWVEERIAALERERQGLWQKVLGAFRGT